MSLLSKLFGSAKPQARLPSPSQDRHASVLDGMRPTVYGGNETLNVVGESHYQANLWQIVGSEPSEARVRHECIAILVAEDDNPHDANAISVWVNDLRVGYLARDDAVDYRPGVVSLSAKGAVGLSGVIVGGGYGGKALLGIFLNHDPDDFGLASIRVTQLRRQLEQKRNPLSRHFMYAELESRLYRMRREDAAVLTEYDEVCRSHDTEMEVIRPALLEEFGGIPLLETYRQQAVRQKKAKNWSEGLRWVQRGLELYGDHALNQNSVDDLQKRGSFFQAKLASESDTTAQSKKPAAENRLQEVEVLTCSRCGRTWEPLRTSGRKPLLCPSCMASETTSTPY